MRLQQNKNRCGKLGGPLMWHAGCSLVGVQEHAAWPSLSKERGRAMERGGSSCEQPNATNLHIKQIACPTCRATHQQLWECKGRCG